MPFGTGGRRRERLDTATVGLDGEERSEDRAEHPDPATSGPLGPWPSTVACLVALALAAGAAAGIHQLLPPRGGLAPSALVATVTGQTVAFLGLWRWLITRNVTLRSLFDRSRLKADIGLGIAAGVVGVVASIVITETMSRLIGEDRPPIGGQAPLDVAALPLLALSVVMLAPLLEETAFRGVFHRGVRSRFGLPFTTMTTAVLFTVAHAPAGAPAAAIWYATASVGLSLLYDWRQSLTVPLVAHATMNGITMCWLAAVVVFDLA